MAADGFSPPRPSLAPTARLRLFPSVLLTGGMRRRWRHCLFRGDQGGTGQACDPAAVGDFCTGPSHFQRAESSQEATGTTRETVCFQFSPHQRWRKSPRLNRHDDITAGGISSAESTNVEVFALSQTDQTSLGPSASGSVSSPNLREGVCSRLWCSPATCVCALRAQADGKQAASGVRATLRLAGWFRFLWGFYDWFFSRDLQLSVLLLFSIQMRQVPLVVAPPGQNSRTTTGVQNPTKMKTSRRIFLAFTPIKSAECPRLDASERHDGPSGTGALI